MKLYLKTVLGEVHPKYVDYYLFFCFIYQLTLWFDDELVLNYVLFVSSALGFAILFSLKNWYQAATLSIIFYHQCRHSAFRS